MTDPAMPMPRPSDEKTARRQVTLTALGDRPAPDAPSGPAGALRDRILVHTGWRDAPKLLDAIPAAHSGLVLPGTASGFKAALKLRETGSYDGMLLIDPEGYTEAVATEEAPFVRPGDALFALTIDEVLARQRTCGTAVVLTPTGYLRAGDSDALKAAAAAAAALDHDDVVFSVPIDVAWLAEDHIDLLIAVLERLPLPKAVFIGGQFDPLKRHRGAVANLRRLVAEGGHVAVLRTDLTAFDVLSHGAFAASIGTGGSRRHIIPFGEKPIAGTGKETDQSPSVLFGDLMAFYKGSTLKDAYQNAIAPACPCPACDGRHLDTFRTAKDSAAAHRHGIHTWCGWLTELLGQPTVLDRANWWHNRSLAAVTQNEIVNVRLERPDALKLPKTLDAWANLAAWAYGLNPAPKPRSRTR